MGLFSSQSIVTQILGLLSEPDGLTARGSTIPQPHWPRTDVLLKADMAQDRIANEFPNLFQATDSSIITNGLNNGYAIPSHIGVVHDVQINGVSLPQTSREALVASSIRGDIVQNWGSVSMAGSGTNFLEWYTVIDDSLVPGTLKPMLYFYPFDSTGGDVVTIQGELLLTQLTDALTNFPFEDVQVLAKAQEILIKLAASWYAQTDGRYTLYASLMQDVYGPDGMSGQMGLLRVQYNVLRTNPLDSVFNTVQSEDSASRAPNWRYRGPGAP